MKLSLYTICVNESEILEETLKHNNKIFDAINIITIPEDNKTIKVCSKYDKINLEITNDFLEDKIINKAKALNILLENLNNKEWIVVAENNCIFPKNIKYELDRITQESMEDDLFSFCTCFINSADDIEDLHESNVIFEKNIANECCQIFNFSSKFLLYMYYDQDNSDHCKTIFSNQWLKKNKHLLNGIVYCLNKIEIKKELIKTKWIAKEIDYKNININEYSTIPAFCINDPNEMANLLFAEKEFEQLEWQVSLRNLIEYHKSPYYRLNSYDASHLDSHKKIWKEIVDKNYPFGAIFEDNVMFASDFKSNFPKMIKDLPEDWDVWHLHATKAKNRACSAHTPIKNYLVKINCSMWGTHGYLVSNKGCKNLLELPDNVPVNLRLSNFNYSKLNIYGIRTSCALAFCRGNKNEEDQQNQFWKEQLAEFYR